MNVLTVLSGKGGVGTSVCAVNLAAVSALQGSGTLLVDLHAGSRALDLLLGVQDRAIYHVGDCLSGTCDPGETALRIPGVRGLSLIPGDPAADGPMDGDQVQEAVRTMIGQCCKAYDRIVIDAGTGWTAYAEAASLYSDLSLLVTTPEAAALRETEALEDRMIRRRVRNRRYLLNRVLPALVFKGIEPEIPEINARIRCGMAGMVLDDENIRAAAGIGVPVVIKQDTYIADNFRKILERLLSI